MLETARTVRREPVPVVAHLAVEVTPGDRRRLAALAGRIAAGEPSLVRLGVGGTAAAAGYLPGRPRVLVHDAMETEALPWVVDHGPEMRAFLLAEAGDVVVLGAPRCPAFEAYCRHHLGFGAVEVLRPPHRHRREPLAIRCARDSATREALAARARSAGGINLEPYLGTRPIWALAAALAEAVRLPVRVAAAPPRLARRVNEKTWFARRVREVLGPRSLPASEEAWGLTALARRVRELAGRFDRIGVKLPSTAAATGNLVLDAAPLRGLALGELRELLRSVMLDREWSLRFPLLVSVWECPVVTSPSVQLWIPARRDGDPVVEGVFDQVVEGPGGEWTGSTPTRLPAPRQAELATEAVLLAVLFQELGYYGRCSFDAILVGEDPATAAIHWVECNGRWGGTSIPMTAVNRLTGDWARTPFVVVRRAGCRGAPQPFSAALEALTHRLYRPGEARGIVFLSPLQVEAGTGCDLLAIGPTVEAARREAAEGTADLVSTAPPAPPAAAGPVTMAP